MSTKYCSLINDKRRWFKSEVISKNLLLVL